MENQKKVIIKLNGDATAQVSPEGVKINKIVSSISPLSLIRLLQHAENQINPRNAKVNRITKSIHETLETSPELLWLKSKGILIATLSCTILERNRVQLTFDDLDHEGIMDGGHNTFAIAIYLVKELFGDNLKTWEECKEFWNANFDEIIKRFQEKKDDFQFSIPIEIIYPNSEPNNQAAAIDDFYNSITEICSARNNNIQLTDVSKGNQIGYYDVLKDLLKGKFDVIWKSGEPGKIKSEDVVSLATLPLIYLSNHGLLPSDLKGLNKISLYSQKSKCVDFFNSVMDHNDISEKKDGKCILKDPYVISGMNMVEDILKFFDQMYLQFPQLYTACSGKFGRIGTVNMKNSKVPFNTTDEMCEYLYPAGFFYPLITGLTSLIEIDKSNKRMQWKINPNNIDLDGLDFSQYVNIIKLVNYDPQKVGKGEVFYKEAESIFDKIAIMVE